MSTYSSSLNPQRPGALQGIRSSLTIPKRRSSATADAADEKPSRRSQGGSQRRDSFHTVNSIELIKDRVDGQKSHHSKPQRRNSYGSQGSFRSLSTSGSIAQGRRVSFNKRLDIRTIENVEAFDQFYTQDDDNEAIEEILVNASSTDSHTSSQHLVNI